MPALALARLEVELGKTKLDNSYIEILKDELNIEEIESVDKINRSGGWEIDEEGFVISLNTKLTEDLKEKGVIREIIRFMNVLRKEAGLKPVDSPVETYQTGSDYLKKVIEKHKDQLIEGTSAGDFIEVSDNPDTVKECSINGEEIILGLK